MKKYVALLIMAALLHAAAPEWIDDGLVVNYELKDYQRGSIASPVVEALQFTVTSVNSRDIEVEVQQGTAKSHPKDNVTGSSGQFWFDPALLSGTLVTGQSLAGWQVNELSAYTALEKEFDSVQLSKTSGQATIRVRYDRETGLLLEHKVRSEGIDIIVASLKSINPPIWNPETAALEEAVPAQEPETAPIEIGAVEQEPVALSAAPEERDLNLPNLEAIPETPQNVTETTTPLTDFQLPTCCCLPTFILMFVGIGAVIRRK